MRNDDHDKTLTTPERWLAFILGALLLALVALLSFFPPQRSVALNNCPDASAGCVVEVDAELELLAAALVTGGSLLALVGVLGVRFNKLKVPHFGEASREDPTAGLEPGPGRADQESSVVLAVPDANATEPIELDEVLNSDAGAVVVEQSIDTADASRLASYRAGIYQSHRDVFVGHVLGPAKQAGQRYSVALFVTGRYANSLDHVIGARFYFGPDWGSRVFEAGRAANGRLGVVVESYSPFLAICEVEFDDGKRILFDRFCDFEMGSFVDV